MLPWRNSWFQIALFAWIVSGTLVIVDYAPRVQNTTGWMHGFQRAPEQPTVPPLKPSPASEQPVPAKRSVPAVETPLPSQKDNSDSRRPVPVQPPATQTPVKKPTDGSKVSATKPDIAKHEPAPTEKPQGGDSETWSLYEKAAAEGNLGAVETVKGAANQGHVSAQYIVGRMYEKGEGVKQDFDEAMKWYGLAAAQGNQSAQQALDRLRTRRSSP